MALLLASLLDDPGLGLRLVAGHGGLHERGPVRWVHSSELPDPTPWLEGGELLLTTGLGVVDSESLQRRLIAGLDEHGCAGVGYGVGVITDTVPRAMIAEADARGLPLFTVPYAVPFIAVTKRVSHHIFAEHYATLRGALDLHRRVLAAVISGAGIDTVVATVTRSLPGFDCVAFDYYGQVLAQRGRSTVEPDGLWAALAPTRRRQDHFEVAVDGRVVSGGLVRVGEEVQAVLALVGDRGLHEFEALLFEQAVAGVSLELARGLSVREARRGSVDDLLHDLMAGRLDRAGARRTLARLGLDADAGYHVLCLRQERANLVRALCTLAEDVLAADGHPVVGRRDEQVYCIVAAERSDHGERIAGAAAARGWSALRVGRSGPRRSVDGLEGAVREAATAAAGASSLRVQEVGDLGLAGLLSGFSDRGAAATFVAHVLGPVIDHDGREATALVATLEAYLRHGCRPGPAAAELGVHRHTLAYRLDRVRQLTGRDPRDGEHLLEFGLALELHGRGPESSGRGSECADAG